jgi:hypothetical protein
LKSESLALDVLDPAVTVSADWVVVTGSDGVLLKQALSNNNNGQSFSDLFIVTFFLLV